MRRIQGFKIREATEDDFYELIVLSKQFYLDSHMSNIFSYDAKKTGEFIKTTIQHKDFYTAIVESEEGETIGCLLALSNECFFSRDVQATVIAWYVKPEYRSLKLMLALISAYEEWAKSKNAKWVNLVNVDMDVPSAFKKLGYSMTEVFYTKENK